MERRKFQRLNNLVRKKWTANGDILEFDSVSSEKEHNAKRKRSCRPQPQDSMKRKWPPRENNSICSVCLDGGDLVLCDLCPSAFHKSCIGLKDVPDGDWFCPACSCGLCGQSILKKVRKSTMNHRACGQCERKYHTWCLKNLSVNMLESDSTGNWFCTESCKQIWIGLHECLGKQMPVGQDSLTWSILKFNSEDTNEPNNDAITKTYCKLQLAFHVMHECFKPDKELHSETCLAEDIIFSRGSDLNHKNFQGFYTTLLEKNDELITVATIRIYGAQVAEIPLIGTRFKYRREGMCRLLLRQLEKMLMDLGVERLVLPTLPSLLDYWSSVGFLKTTDSQRLQLLDYRFVEFENTIICQKSLMKIPLAEPCPSKGTPLVTSGSVVDNIESDGSIGDIVSLTWKIDSFSTLLCTKKYSDTFLTGQLRWRILLYPKGRENVDDLSVSFDVEGGSELPIGWSRNVQISMTMVNQLQCSKSISKETKLVFNKRESDCGFTSLISLNELNDPSEGYLVNDTCIIEVNIAVYKARVQISHAQKTDMESAEVPHPSSAACKATCFKNVTACQDATTSRQVFIELPDTNFEPTLNMEPMKVPDLSSATRNATSFQNVTASQEQVIELSDSSTDNSLDKEFVDVYSTSPPDLMNFRGYTNMIKEFVPLLEEACFRHPSLIESQKGSSPQYTEWAFIALGRVLHFLKTKKVMDMTTQVCKDLHISWNELKSFGFDLTWLEPHINTALAKSKDVEKAADQVKKVAENVKALTTQLVAAKNELKNACEGFDAMNMEELGYQLW